MNQQSKTVVSLIDYFCDLLQVYLDTGKYNFQQSLLWAFQTMQKHLTNKTIKYASDIPLEVQLIDVQCLVKNSLPQS